MKNFKENEIFYDCNLPKEIEGFKIEELSTNIYRYLKIPKKIDNNISILNERGTLKELQKLIIKKNIPDNAKIVVERVEDVYYEKHGWNNNSEIISSDIYPQDSTTLTPCHSVGYNKKKNQIIIWMHY